jgi:prepilin-type N-terminal cleavage/methylation domain-containing protein
MLGRTANGFTLVEVLVALTVIAVGVVSLAQLALTARGAANSAWMVTTASVLAQDQMERLRATGWPSASTTWCCDFFDGNGEWLASGGDPPVGTTYARRWSVTPLPADPSSACVLQVWITSRRPAGSIRLVGVRARRSG